jgi:hypothetical protein
MLRPRLKLESLSNIRCLLVLTLTFNCTEVLVNGTGTCEPCSESQVPLKEAGEDWEGSKNGVFGDNENVQIVWLP